MFDFKTAEEELSLHRAFEDVESVLGRYSNRSSRNFRHVIISHPAYPLVLCEAPFVVVEQILFLTTQYTHLDLKRRLASPEDTVIKVVDRLAIKFAERDVHPDGVRRYMVTANQVLSKVMLGQTSFLAVYLGPSYTYPRKGKHTIKRQNRGEELPPLQHKDTRVFRWRSSVESMSKFPSLLQGVLIPYPMALGKFVPPDELGKVIAETVKTAEFGESVVRFFSTFRQNMIGGEAMPETSEGLVRVFFMDNLPMMFVTLHVVPTKVQVRKKGNGKHTSMVHYEIRIRKDNPSDQSIFCACPCGGGVVGVWE